MKTVFDIVHRAQTAALKTARPGLECQAVDAAARSVITDAGYGPDYKFFTHRVGHGMGMDGHEWPYLVRGNTTPMAANMTFSDEPGIYIRGEFGIRLEDDMHITENGAELFHATKSIAGTSIREVDRGNSYQRHISSGTLGGRPFFVLPLVMLIVAGVAAITAHHDSSRNIFRALRYVVGAEVVFVLVMAAVGALYQAISTNREQRLYPPPGKLVDIGGYRIHLHCSGEGGPTVILDYGRVGSYLDWYQVQPQVARFTRVCSYDRGGYGWSDPSPKPRLPSVMAEELHTLLTTAGEKPPYVLVGHSFGSFDVLMYAHKYREEVAGIVLVDGSHPDQHLPFQWRDRVWLRTMQFTAPFGLPRWRRWCGGGPPEIAPIRTAIFCRSHVYRTDYAQWAAFPQSADEVRKVGALWDLPLHVISRDPDRRPGSDDPTFSSREQHWLKLQQELLQLSTNATHTIAAGSGHDVMKDRPDVVVEAIRQMVERVSKR